ncbi:MAG: hypothetical protein ACPGUV_05390 [Polyangiales bacterium]
MWGGGLLLAVGLGAWSAGSRASAQGRDPRLLWHSVQSRHFIVHYHQPLGVMARQVLAIAERAHAWLVPVMGHQPKTRTQIVLSDVSDSANGSAAALPYNAIRLFATAPEDLSPLNDVDDWMHVLVSHEHTHILHLDDWGGVASVINAIFGRLYAPNQVLPRWYIEGYATFEESRLSSAGRLRSSFFEMYLRMDALEERLWRLDQLSHLADRWPHGNAWYLYGSRFVDFLYQRYGHQALSQIAHDYGRALLPYGLSRVLTRVTGRGLEPLYDAFLNDYRKRQNALKARLVTRGLRVGRRLTWHGEQSYAPRFVDNAHVIYTRADGRDPPHLRALNVHSGRTRHLGRIRGRGEVSCPNAVGTLLYSGIDTFRDLHSFYDLFVLEWSSGRRRRLTRGLRARAPDLSPDGRHVVFTVNHVGTTHLAMAETRDVASTVRILWRSARGEQVYTPRFSPDGRKVVFSRWQQGGYRDLWLLERQSGQLRRLTHDRAVDSGPSFSPDGQWLLYSSDQSGIANLYALHLDTGHRLQLTRVLGGAFQPSVSPDGRQLVYLGYTSRGFDLFLLPFDAHAPARSAADVALDPVAAHIVERPTAPPPLPPMHAVAERYRPGPTLLPRSYSLGLEPNTFGQELTISASGQDVVGMHRYQSRVGVGLERGETNVDFLWSVQHLLMPTSLRLLHRIDQRGGLQVAGAARNWIGRLWGAELSTGYTFARGLHSNSLSTTYALTHTSRAAPLGGVLDPNTPPPVLPVMGRDGRVDLRWSFRDTQRQVYDISISSGRNLQAAVSWFEPRLGSRQRRARWNWSAAQYVRVPWTKLHVLALRYGGGISLSAGTDAGAFALGGFPQSDLLDDLIENRALGGVALRGYPPLSQAGSQFHLLQSEYRLPLWRPTRGYAILPLFFNRLHLNLFTDIGEAFTDTFTFDALRVGSGAELLSDWTLGYNLLYTLRLGFAYGWQTGGGLQMYVNFGVPF